MLNAFNRHREEIAGLVDERFYPMEWIEQSIERGSIAVFHNDTSIIGVEKRIYPGGAVELHGLFAAGCIKGILELIDLAVEAGRRSGCTVATISSREGWGRLLKSRGFEPHQTSILKELN